MAEKLCEKYSLEYYVELAKKNGFDNWPEYYKWLKDNGKLCCYWQFIEYDTFYEMKKINFIIEHIKKYCCIRHIDFSDINILEIGCGPGNITIPLAYLGFNVLGIDINKTSIQIATDRNIFKNAFFSVINVEQFSTNLKFDVIICSEVFEHLKNPNEIMRSISLLLKDDGILVITIPNGFGPLELLWDIPFRLGIKMLKTLKLKKIISIRLNSRLNTYDRPGFYHVKNYSMNTFKKMIETNNLTIKEMKHSIFLSFFPIIRIIKTIRFVYYDSRLADVLPSFLVSGWYFICERNSLCSINK